MSGNRPNAVPRLANPAIGPVATGGCGLETSIWPLRILFRGYGTKLGAFRQRLGGSYPEKSKWRHDLSNIDCSSPAPSDGNACSTRAQ